MQIPYRTRKQARWRKLLVAGFIISLPLLAYEFSESAETQAASQQKAGPEGAVKTSVPSPQEDLPGLAKINNVRYWITDEYTRVVFDLNDAARFEKRRADKGVFQFDLLGAQLGPPLDGKVLPVDNSPLREIHLAQHTSDSVRVSLDLTRKAEYTIFSLQNPYRIVIDVRGPKAKPKLVAGRRPDRSVVPETVETTPDQAKDKALAKDKLATHGSATKALSEGATAAEPAKDKKEISSVPMGGRPMQEAMPTSAGPTSLIRTLGLKIGKIVIDPGHGGWDNGTVGKTGLKEKDVALDVARRLGKMLEERLGAQVVLTRTDDRFIALEERTAVANAHAADLFISIHVNASKNASARGIETYFLSLTATGDAREVVARENASAQKSIHELEELVKKITLTEKINESKEFASTVQQNLFKGISAHLTKTTDRGVKRAPFIVLIGAKMPSILAEIAFLSNLTDEKFLRQESSREKIADSIYRGIEAYIRTLGSGNLVLKEKGK